MAITLTLLSINTGLGKQRIGIRLALSGNYPAGGDTLDLTTLVGQAQGMGIFIANAPPTFASDIVTSTGAGTGWMGAFLPGTTLANGKAKFIVTSTGAEHATGAYTAA